MKRASYISILVFIFLVFCEIYAQVSGVADITRNVRMKINVKMAGLGYSVNIGGSGSERTITAPVLDFGLVADTFAATDTLVNPCDFIHQIFWVENLGAIPIDFDLWDLETAADWSKNLTAINMCAHLLGENEYSSCQDFTQSDGDSLTPVPGAIGWETMPIGGAGATSELEGMWGEDPADPVDGTWAFQTDQREMHLGIVCPYSCTEVFPTQLITFVVMGKVHD